jgi:hypothetical protein
VDGARRTGWFFLGFLTATLAAALVQVPKALAQQTPRTYWDTRPSGPVRPTAPIGARDRQSEQEPVTAAASTRTTTSRTGDETDGDEPFDAERDNGALPNFRRGPAGDGDLSASGVFDTERDRLREPREPALVLDGGDPTVDTRPKEESDLFQNPPAGHDPLLFQIEDIKPIETDRRPARLFRQEPYDPAGIKFGSFVYFPEIEVTGVATNNVRKSTDAKSDTAVEVKTESRLVSNWSSHALELRSTSLTSFHNHFPSEDDRAWGVEARGRLDVSRHTNFEGLLSHDVAQESRSAIDASGSTGERPDVVTDTASLSFNHRFNRLSLQLRGSVSDTDYSSVETATTFISNDDRDVRSSEEAVRATWEFKPSFKLFSEAELNQRRYDFAAGSDGIFRNSDGERYRAGFDFGSNGQFLRGEVSVGYGQQTPDDARLRPVDAFLLDANLAWRPTNLTSFLLTARSDISDTTNSGSGGVVSQQFGLEARHVFRRYLIASAGLSYTDNDYDAAGLKENELTTTVGLEYFANRDVILFGRYQHNAFGSNQPASDYHSDDFRLGVRLRR